jgi:divalent metal cation (Fe/Co/Zn/Cd) transporter
VHYRRREGAASQARDLVLGIQEKHRVAEATMGARVPEAARLRRRGLWLASLSMAWTMVVAVIAIWVGTATSSIAVIGLGLESAIELVAASVVIWRLAGEYERETRAIRLIGVIIVASALYLSAESIAELAGGHHGGHPTAGLVVAAAALVVMPLLARQKRRTGRALGSETLAADAAETTLTAVAAAAVLAGVGLDTWLGWWWTVPAAGLAIAIAAFIEGFHIWAHHH